MVINSSNQVVCSIQGTSGTNQHESIGQPTTGSWQHFVCVFDRDSAIIGYENGVQQIIRSYDSGNTNSVDTGTSFSIGSHANTSWFFSGDIDDVRIYNRALTAAEINDLYNEKKATFIPADNTGLVGYWSLNEGRGTSAGDSSGSGQDGTLTNMDAATDWIDGQRGKALDFDGTNDRIQITKGSNLTAITEAGGSIAAWVKFDVTPTTHGNLMGIVDLAGTGTSGAILYATNSDDKILMQVGDGVSATRSAPSTTAITPDTWYHVVGTWDSGDTAKIKIYVNGSLENSNSDGAIDVVVSSGTLYLGSNQTNVSRHLNGQLDEVRIYNRELSADEVTALYNSGFSKINSSQDTVVSSGLLHRWTFDGPTVSGTTVNDTVGSNNGTLTNGPVVGLGRVGQGLAMDGDDDSVLLGSSFNLSDPSTWAVTAWVQVTSSDTMSVLTNSSGGPVANDFRIQANKMVYYHYDGAWQSETGTTTISDGEWHHLAWVNRGTDDMDMYVDGVKELSSVASDITNDGPVNQLGKSWGSGTAINGTLDDVRVYSRALSDAEVMTLAGENPSLVDGLIGHWPLNETSGSTAFDFSDSGNNGTHSGTPTVNQTGIHGVAYDFDGTDDYILGGSNLGISGDAEFTMCAWIYWDSGTWSSGFPSFMGNNTTASVGSGLSFTVSSGRPAVDFWNNRWRADNALSVQTWYHVCGTKTPGTISDSTTTIYVNGVKVAGAVETASTAPNITDSPPVIGRLDATRWFDGDIDEVRFYNRALTPLEIKQLYQMGGKNL